MDPSQIIERERRWATPVALLTILGVVLFAVSLVLLASKYGQGGNAELLRKVDKDSGTLILAYMIRALGSALLAVPLVYLFRAALARSETMRGQLIGLAIAGPLFLAGLAVATGLSLHAAAPDFVAKGIAGTGDHADKVAQNVISDQSLSGLTVGFGIAGTLGFAVAMAYTCFHAMRVGLLTRFWGSLGAALGVASILVLQYTLLWIAYLGLLIGGWTPKGRPPAWAEGKAIPWPTAGEKAAESLEGESDPPASSDQDGDGDDGEVGTVVNPVRQPGERRKRKRRR
ncbi:MAG: hypothetical protein M3R23_06685 [Actinomycetota bacterium]|nr:hypothetical protein [Actinomycetota bacterium]